MAIRMRPRLHAATGEAAKRENIYHVDWMEQACMAKLPRDLREAVKQ